MSIQVILVEDELDIASEVVFHLQRHGMNVRHATDGPALDQLLTQQPCDVLVLDLGLQGEDGLTIAERLHQRDDLRIVMLTARVMPQDRIQGFHSGADVYLTKPVNMQELAAVIERLAGRMPGKKAAIEIDAKRQTLQTDGQAPIELTGMECRFLTALAQAKDLSLTRSALEDALWVSNEDMVARRMEVMVSRLRQKLSACGLAELIKTEWRVGYRLTQTIYIR